MTNTQVHGARFGTTFKSYYIYNTCQSCGKSYVDDYEAFGQRCLQCFYPIHIVSKNLRQSLDFLIDDGQVK